MSEEIKETLDDIKRHLDYVEATKQSSIRDNEIKIMYDYITSLQQKVEQLESIRKEAIEWVVNHKEKLHHSFDEPDWDYLLYGNAIDLLNILNKGDNKE